MTAKQCPITDLERFCALLLPLLRPHTCILRITTVLRLKIAMPPAAHFPCGNHERCRRQIQRRASLMFRQLRISAGEKRASIMKIGLTVRNSSGLV